MDLTKRATTRFRRAPAGVPKEGTTVLRVGTPRCAPCSRRARAVLAAPLPCFWTSQTPYSVQTGHGGAPSAFDGPQPLPRSVHTPAPYVDLTGCSFGPFPLDIASPKLCLLPCRLRVDEFLLSLAKIRTSLCSVLGLPNSA